MQAGAGNDPWVKPLIAAGSLAYLAAAAVLIVRVGDPLFSPIYNYFPAFSWELLKVDAARLAALASADRLQTAVLYERLEIASALLVIFGMVIGAVGAFLKGRRLEANTGQLTGLLILCFLFYAFFTVGTAILDLGSAAHLLPWNLAAYPGVWFLTMVPMAVLVAFTFGLLINTAILRIRTPMSQLLPKGEDDPVYY